MAASRKPWGAQMAFRNWSFSVSPFPALLGTCASRRRPRFFWRLNRIGQKFQQWRERSVASGHPRRQASVSCPWPKRTNRRWITLTRAWRQGDVSLNVGLEFVHFADLLRPHSPASDQAADGLVAVGGGVEAGATVVLDAVHGVVELSQTCDVVRGCRARPFVEVAPLVEASEIWVEEIRRLKRPAFAYVPKVAHKHLVADLDRVMTVEKALVAGWNRTPGWEEDAEVRDFASALARKRSRFAFPAIAAMPDRIRLPQLRRWLAKRATHRTCEGRRPDPPCPLPLACELA